MFWPNDQAEHARNADRIRTCPNRMGTEANVPGAVAAVSATAKNRSSVWLPGIQQGAMVSVPTMPTNHLMT